VKTQVKIAVSFVLLLSLTRRKCGRNLSFSALVTHFLLLTVNNFLTSC